MPHVIKVHGKGLLLGIELDISAKQLQINLLKEKIITGTSANSKILRLMPPLIINEYDIQLFMNKLKKILQKI